MAYSNLSAAQKQARATALNTAIGANATIRIYTGAQPAGPDTAATGTLLATLTCGSGGFGTATSGVITASAISRVTILDRAGREASRADCREIRVTDLQTGEIIFAAQAEGQ